MNAATMSVARSTFREAVRDRVMFLVVGFGAGILVLSRVLAPLAMGETGRVTVDLGLATLGLLGLIIVALVGTGLVHKELERRTIYIVLTRPVSRASYLVGKWLGLTTTMAVAVVAMGTILVAIAVPARGPAIIGPLTQAIVLIVCANALLAALAVLFSSLSTPVLSTVYTLGLYATGYWTRDLRDFAHSMPAGLADMLRTISYLVPNLDLFNLRSDVAQGTVAGGMHMTLAIAYAAAYVTAVLALAVVAFERRELK
jgi:ABC-type transport system involved in multi-copper enzyme maturation permease subunit